MYLRILLKNDSVHLDICSFNNEFVEYVNFSENHQTTKMASNFIHHAINTSYHCPNVPAVWITCRPNYPTQVDPTYWYSDDVTSRCFGNGAFN